MRLGVAEATLPGSIGDLIPRLAGCLPDSEYNREANVLAFWLEDVYVALYPDKVLLNRVKGREHAEQMIRKVDEAIESALAAEEPRPKERPCNGHRIEGGGSDAS